MGSLRVPLSEEGFQSLIWVPAEDKECLSTLGHLIYIRVYADEVSR